MSGSRFSLWFVGTLLLLPLKVLVLLLIPVVFGVVGIVKFLSHVRTQLQRQEEGRVDLERMKRVN